MPTFVNRIVSRGKRGGSPTVVNLSFLDRSRYFSFKVAITVIIIISSDLLEIGLSVVDWIGLAQDRYRRRALVNSVMNLRVP
jgi:hypothetical protein